ncbi:hypothetical protein RJ641_029737 [Dillenia turbinata]|uniref:Probable purine permease n=1 Tax=Dillenia turbinata TaxID=194707 RepID=A0AAN8W1X8_9MAGN
MVLSNSPMEVESTSEQTKKHNNKKKFMTIVNCSLLALGTSGGPLIMRLYFIHGGKKDWLSSWLETGGWPLNIIPILLSYLRRRKKAKSQQHSPAKLFFITPRLFLASAVLGLLTGLDDYLYAYGVARLPVSTSSLIISTQLAFTAAFAFLLVKQKFTASSINAVFLLSIGAGVLAMHSSGDRPKNETGREYYMGFAMTIGAAALYGFVLPAVELTYKKAKQKINYSLVMEMQMVISLFATVFCTVGMLVNGDFQTIAREAKEFGLGEAMYYFVLVMNGLIWQCFFLGAIGVIFCGSSLLSGILIAVFIPITEILAVLFYHESFQAEKAVSLVLCIWGFISYFYGEFQQVKKMKKQRPHPAETELPAQPQATSAICDHGTSITGRANV